MFVCEYVCDCFVLTKFSPLSLPLSLPLSYAFSVHIFARSHSARIKSHFIYLLNYYFWIAHPHSIHIYSKLAMSMTNRMSHSIVQILRTSMRLFDTVMFQRSSNIDIFYQVEFLCYRCRRSYRFRLRNVFSYLKAVDWIESWHFAAFLIVIFCYITPK